MAIRYKALNGYKVYTYRIVFHVQIILNRDRRMFCPVHNFPASTNIISTLHRELAIGYSTQGHLYTYTYRIVQTRDRPMLCLVHNFPASTDIISTLHKELAIGYSTQEHLWV